MTRVQVTRDIAAPVERVFGAITQIEKLPETNPDIVSVELLTEQREGVGTKFREIRRMGKSEHPTDLEIVELVPDESTRMISDAHGTVWDTLFRVRATGDGGTRLDIIMDARPHKLLPRLLNPIMKGVFRSGLDKHIEALKAHCERKG